MTTEQTANTRSTHYTMQDLRVEQRCAKRDIEAMANRNGLVVTRYLPAYVAIILDRSTGAQRMVFTVPYLLGNETLPHSGGPHEWTVEL